MKKKILLVEDDKDFVELIRTRLESLGWEVIHLDDGTHVVKVARENIPDVILLDIFLPEMDGFTTLKALKAKLDPETGGPSKINNIPTIVMTGKAPMMEDVVRFEGACEFLTKPIDVPALVKRIEQMKPAKMS